MLDIFFSKGTLTYLTLSWTFAELGWWNFTPWPSPRSLTASFLSDSSNDDDDDDWHLNFRSTFSRILCTRPELTHFPLLFHMRHEHVPGQACCAGPVGERRCGQEHHHHRVSPGSQACWQEGEHKAQLCTCAAEYRVSVYANMLLLLYLKRTKKS